MDAKKSLCVKKYNVDIGISLRLRLCSHYGSRTGLQALGVVMVTLFLSRDRFQVHSSPAMIAPLSRHVSASLFTTNLRTQMEREFAHFSAYHHWRSLCESLTLILGIATLPIR
jgi:hypothetical protein